MGSTLFLHSIRILSDGCTNFRKLLARGHARPNSTKISEYVERSLMLVTALAPVMGYDKASAIAHHAMETRPDAKRGGAASSLMSMRPTFDRIVDPAKTVKPHVAMQE